MNAFANIRRKQAARQAARDRAQFWREFADWFALVSVMLVACPAAVFIGFAMSQSLS